MNQPDLLEVANRRVTVEELRDALERPIDEAEREEILSLVRWFTRRYPTPRERLAYIRQAYARWTAVVEKSKKTPSPEGDGVL